MARCIRNRQKVTTFDLTRLLKPKSLAVVGASARPDSYGAMVLNKLLGHRYPGSIYPINPKRDEWFAPAMPIEMGPVEGAMEAARARASATLPGGAHAAKALAPGSRRSAVDAATSSRPVAGAMRASVLHTDAANEQISSGCGRCVSPAGAFVASTRPRGVTSS